MIIIGIILMLLGLVCYICGDAINNDMDRQMESLFNNGVTNPGSMYVTLGIVILIVGIIFLITGIARHMQKNAYRQNPVGYQKCYCANCGQILPVGATFCSQCGAKLMTQKSGTMGTVKRPQKAAIGRKEYFKNVADKKVHGKIVALNILTGIIIAICAIGIICSIIMGIEGMNMSNAQSSFEEEVVKNFWYVGVSYSLGMCLADFVLCILGIQFKHYGFYIPTFLLSMVPIKLAEGGIYRLFGFQVMNGISNLETSNKNAVSNIMPQIVATFGSLMWVVVIAALVLSILLTRDYKNNVLRAN